MFRRLKSLWKGRWLSDEQYRAEVAKLVDQRPVPLFWLVGKTGSGKTSVVRYLTGAADAEIGNGFRPQTRDSRRYDFPSVDEPLLRFLDTRGLGEARYDPTEDLRAFDAQADLVIVTARLLDHALAEVVTALRTIRAARPSRPVLLVLTCVHEAYPGQQHPEPDPVTTGTWPEAAPESIRRSFAEQQARFDGLVDRVVLVDLTRPDDGFRNSSLGGEGLTQALVDMLPAALRQTFVSWTDTRKSLRDLQARRAAPYILGYSLAAASAAAVPFPWVDLPVVFGLQVHLLKKLAELHDQPTNHELLQALGPLSGRVLLSYATRELLKAVPVVGQAANAALAFTYTYGMGQAALWYFAQARGGSTPSTDDVRRIWRDEIEKAQTIWKQRHDAAGEPTS